MNKYQSTFSPKILGVFLLSNFGCLFLVLIYGISFSASNQSLLFKEVTILVLVWISTSYMSYSILTFNSWCSNTKETYEAKWHTNIAELVKKKYRPLMRTLTTMDEVALASRELISESKNQPIYLNGRVIFLGAASNQSDKSQRDSLSISEDSERTPAQVYQGAIEELMSNVTPVFRIISLLTEEEFARRSLIKKRQYVSWLRNQVSQLKRNKNYVVYDNKRAPKWSSSGASIFTNGGFLQFTSSRGDALLIKDEWIAKQLVRSIMFELSGTEEKNKSAFTQMEVEEFRLYKSKHQFGENIPAERLEQYMDKLIELV